MPPFCCSSFFSPPTNEPTLQTNQRPGSSVPSSLLPFLFSFPFFSFSFFFFPFLIFIVYFLRFCSSALPPSLLPPCLPVLSALIPVWNLSLSPPKVELESSSFVDLLVCRSRPSPVIYLGPELPASLRTGQALLIGNPLTFKRCFLALVSSPRSPFQVANIRGRPVNLLKPVFGT